MAIAGTNTARITTGATGLSGAVDLGQYRLAGVIIPATWVAAALTFQVSGDGTTFGNAYVDNGTTQVELSIPSAGVVASRAILFTGDFPLAFSAIQAVKVRSGTAASPVDQTATRLVTLLLAPR